MINRLKYKGIKKKKGKKFDKEKNCKISRHFISLTLKMQKITKIGFVRLQKVTIPKFCEICQFLLMISLFFVFCISHRVEIVYTASFSTNVVTTYGFRAGGKYNLTVKSKLIPMSIVFLSKETYRERSYRYYCEHRDQYMKTFNVSRSIDNSTYSLSGYIHHDGVYKLYLFMCTNKQANFAVEGSFSNPDTQLDTRNRYLRPLFMQMSIIYIFVFIYWFSRSQVLHVFRYPLHTTFMLLQLIRSLNLYIWYYTWTVLSETDKLPLLLEFTTHFLDILYYTTLTSCLLFLCSGCNIFRIKFSVREHIEIIGASLFVTTGIIIIPLVRTENFLILAFTLVVIGLVWYISIGITSMIKAHRIIVLVSEKPSLMIKIQRSRKVVSFAYSLSLTTLTIYIILYLTGIPEFACAVIMEIGCFLCTFVLLWFYTEVPPRAPATLIKHSNLHPCMLSSPSRTELVLISSSKDSNDQYDYES